MSPRHSSAGPFVVIELRAEATLAERAVAEAYAAGAVGLEEREGPEGIVFALYAPAERGDAVRAALRTLPGLRVSAPVALVPVDWSEAWKQGLGPIEISERLMLRPSFDATPGGPGQRVLTLDPGQAFGTGAHESTRLALECLDTIAPELGAGTRLLDVGTGSGVLALAALALGCGRVCAFDNDPLAGEATRENAARNELETGLALFVGEPGALRVDTRFDWVLANMLLDELLSVLPTVGALTASDGGWIVSGLLESQRAEWERAAERHGLVTRATRQRSDASGAVWTGLVMRRVSARASR